MRALFFTLIIKIAEGIISDTLNLILSAIDILCKILYNIYNYL